MPAADLIDIKKFRAPRKRGQPVPTTRVPWPLPFAVEVSLQFLRSTLDDLAQIPKRQTIGIRRVLALVIDQLELALAAHNEQPELDAIFAKAWELQGKVEDVRQTLERLLAMSPDPRDC